MSVNRNLVARALEQVVLGMVASGRAEFDGLTAKGQCTYRVSPTDLLDELIRVGVLETAPTEQADA